MARFKCFDCEDIEELPMKYKGKHMHCECGGHLELEYRNNYEKDYEATICNTCIHNRVGDGEKCSYCNQI